MRIVEGGLDDPTVVALLEAHVRRARSTRHGFVECPPFGDYRADPNSVFMTLAVPRRG